MPGSETSRRSYRIYGDGSAVPTGRVAHGGLTTAPEWGIGGGFMAATTP